MVKKGVISEEEQVELIEGELIVIPPTPRRNAPYLDRIAAYLGDQLEKVAWRYGKNHVHVQEHLSINSRLELRPDISVITPRVDFYPVKDQRKDEFSLIIEIGDGDFDYQRLVRLPIYTRLAVIEVWFVNPDEGVIQTHTFAKPSEGTYEYVDYKRRGESMWIHNLPDLHPMVDDILG